MRSDLKSARKVAIELDIKYTTLQYWIQTGVIEPTIIGRNGRGFVYGFSKDDVNKLDSFSKERKRIRKEYSFKNG